MCINIIIVIISLKNVIIIMVIHLEFILTLYLVVNRWGTLRVARFHKF